MKKGIILTGGLGTRLLPLTSITNKQLLPIHKKPIIDYSINTLINLGCKEITIILGGEHFDQIVAYLKDGADKGVYFNYVYQSKPSGIAQAINLCEPYFNKEDEFAVILGDNIFEKPIEKRKTEQGKAQIVLYDTPEIHRFGCASIRKDKIVRIEEKPKKLYANCDFNLAITGLYIFTSKFFEYFKKAKPSERGEYEITEIINCYLQDNLLDFSFTNGRWLDAGTFETIDMARKLAQETKLEDRLI
jgi:glucose-1-phosphate thymidylyltransferase